MKSIVTLLVTMAVVMTSCQEKKKQTQEVFKSEPTENWIGDQTIYEVNIRQYTPEGTITAFAQHLPRLEELGVDILWIMPIHPISEKNRKGSLGSYYAVQDYKAVNPEFGTTEDFKKLVRKAHELGMKVVLDWVANHTGWDHQWVTEHPEYYTQVDGKIVAPVEDWADVADLNYDNKEMRKEMIDALRYWVDEVGIDGYRCDMAAMVPTDFWEEARVEIEKNRPIFMLAEAWEPELTEQAFDLSYGWDFHHLMNDIAKGEKNASAIPPFFAHLDTLYHDRTIVMNFIDNHDENSWAGTVKERMGDGHLVYALLTYTVPGTPLIYSGQEVGLDHRLRFFEKDTIHWNRNQHLTLFYQQLNKMRKMNSALYAGKEGGDIKFLATNKEKECIAFTRTNDENQVFVLLNFTDKSQKVKLKEKLDGMFTSFFTHHQKELNGDLVLPPFGYAVYTRSLK